MILSGCLQGNAPSAPEKEVPEKEQAGSPSLGIPKHPYTLPSIGLPQLPPQRIGELNGLVEKNLSLDVLAEGPTAPLNMRILIISPTANDNTLFALESLLMQVGVPYDVLIATEETLTNDKLRSNGKGLYQGIFLTDGALTYDTGGGNFESAFTLCEPNSSNENNDEDCQWNILWQYERDFKVRQVSMFTFPGTIPEDLGVLPNGLVDTTGTPLNVNLTLEGQSIFSSLKTNATIPIKSAFTYLAASNSNSPELATPLLEDSAGNIVAISGILSDGREHITLFMGHNPFLLHTQLLGYDLLNWVTQGVFIGERRMYMHTDVDDWFQESDVWVHPDDNSSVPSTFRMSGQDALSAREHLLVLRDKYPQASTLIYNNFFNAAQADLNASIDCSATASLTGATLCINHFFYWGNHTFTEQDMDFTDYVTSKFEVEANISYAQGVGLNFNPNSLVTGTHSGLGYYLKELTPNLPCVVEYSNGYCEFGLDKSNPVLLHAADELDVRYMGANRSLQTQTAACDSCGIFHPLEPSIMLIPRWPTNVFFNVTTPDQVISEFNYFYGPEGIFKDGNGNPFFNHNLNYTEYLDFEAGIALYHILIASPYPHFFHQGNLFEYESGKSLLADWTDTVLQKYTTYLNLPIITLEFPDMGDLIKERTSFFDAAASGVWFRDSNTVNITSNNGGTIFVTGAELSGEKWNYGNARVSKVNLGAGQTVSGTVITDTANNQAPIMNTVGDQTSLEGDTVSLSILASDADGDSLTYLAAGLPIGLAINSQTGVISGTLPINSAGQYSIIVSVSDGIALVSKSFSWTVTPPPPVTILEANFDSGTNGFSYQDDSFRNTNQPSYASGQRLSSGGYSGGGLSVLLGGLNDADIFGMSGGWKYTFNLDRVSPVRISLHYKLTQASNYEADELSQILISVDGVLKGIPPNDYVMQINGNGNGGGNITTGWQFVNLDLGQLGIGTHTLYIGGYNNKKTYFDEQTQIVIDNIRIVANPSVSTTVLEASFNTSTDGFNYSDDPFLNTNQPFYARGYRNIFDSAHSNSLFIELGGVDHNDIFGMSGGWTKNFSLSKTSNLVLSFSYRIAQSSEYESDEFSQALISVDGSLYGLSPNDYIYQIVGNGNGGGILTSGWQNVEVDLGSFSSGSHTLTIGGYNNKKTYSNELTIVVIDDVNLTSY